ncbi:UNKNOWN [Stylonychia lemnae]|uniref:Uncharacterized protein n=1 Tax=Stylonychia lemnae TaxID=5949 RepID=A0A078B2Y3_STYLE|nr:UNKNOWN [Stylonychia lemnae]|eukprot:CDW87868.1 UNKNOWN [Stylonychia lemnae]
MEKSQNQSDKATLKESLTTDSTKQSTRHQTINRICVSIERGDKEFDLDFDMLSDMYEFHNDDDKSLQSQSFVSESMTSESIIDDYLLKRQENVQINTVQLLDDIYDKHLIELPDDLIAALKEADNTKVTIISELFAFKILQIEMEIVENEDSEQRLAFSQQYKNQLLKQRSEVEKYINACLVDRIISEKKFKYINKILPAIQKRLRKEFYQLFQKNMFVNESQILKKYNFEFLEQVEQNFQRYAIEEIQSSIGNDVLLTDYKVLMVQFFQNYLLSKAHYFLNELKNNFITEFQTSYEQDWNIFLQNYINEENGPKIVVEDLQTLFNILIRLPASKEIKLEIVQLESKLTQFAFMHNLEINIDDYWTQQDEIEAYLISLHQRLMQYEQQREKENAFSSLIYELLNYFIRDCYTASDRELLKMFFMTIQPKVREIIMSNQEINIGFYLTIFEKEISEANPISEYQLKDIIQSKFQNNLATFGIDKSIEKTSILNLQRISTTTRSKHVVICLSGFLTEDVEKEESWRLVVNHYKYAEVFALTWNSLSVSNFWTEGHYKERGGSGFMAKVLFIKSGKKQFKYAIEQTKVAGTLLALFLLKTDFSNDKAITLIGHSLGTVIIFQVLNVLHHFYKQGNYKAGRIIHDVFLWGGALVLTPQGKYEEIIQKSKLCGVVNGKLSNVYSLKDYVLKYMFMSVMSKFEPIGMIPIFEDVPEYQRTRNMTPHAAKMSTLKKAHNYDCTVECPGHMTYSVGANLVLEKIPNSF